MKEAYTRYIDSKTNVLSPSTIREYRRSARNDLQDIMPLKLRDITQEAVQRSINQFAANHAPKTVRNAHGLLSAVLGVYYPSFQLSTGLPQKQKARITIPTEAEVKALLHPQRYGRSLCRSVAYDFLSPNPSLLYFVILFYTKVL